MGYYFPKAKTTADLNPQQIERYKMLRSEGMKLPPQLKDRFEAVKERVGPLTSGEIISAFEELWQDAVVCWVLSGENPNIAWDTLEERKDERTPEQRQRDREEWEQWVNEHNNRIDQINHPIRTFFRRLFAPFRKEV